MTAPSTPRLETHGEVAALMPTAWKEAISPHQFAEGCLWIERTMMGARAHIAFDLWSNLTLASLGYCDGVAIFERAVAGWHEGAKS